MEEDQSLVEKHELSKVPKSKKTFPKESKKLASAIAYIKKKPYLCTRITEVTHRMIR